MFIALDSNDCFFFFEKKLREFRKSTENNIATNICFIRIKPTRKSKPIVILK